MLGRLCLLALLAAGMAMAQRGGGRRSQNTSDDGPVMRPEIRESRFDRFSGRLKLNKDQKTAAGTILDEAQKEATPVAEVMAKARVAAVEAMINGKSADDVNKLLAAYTQSAAQMTGIEAKAFARICAGLKPNQQSKAGPAFDEMAGIFLSRDWRRTR
jgi:hypothetical protein